MIKTGNDKQPNADSIPNMKILLSQNWMDYELLDSGDGQKLERFGPNKLVRPEVQALWNKKLSGKAWLASDAVFQPTGEESGGHWILKEQVPRQWEMNYPLSNLLNSRLEEQQSGGKELRFLARITHGRHLGVFPECAAHWEWMAEKISKEAIRSSRKLQILNLFGYTGLASLVCAAAGAKVTHVDASKKSVKWARENQSFSRLEKEPIRWIVDDALKFVEREARRKVKYDGILLDPPKFGRGPKGEVWEVYRSLPVILRACQKVLSDQPLFVILTVYAVKLSALHTYNALADIMKYSGGKLDCGELVTREKSAGRLLSQAVFARWSL
jgi:23S rRNA (cytosine1962-C5)-methyltransferase